MLREIAKILDGMAYESQMPEDALHIARENRIVIVYGWERAKNALAWGDACIEVAGAVRMERDFNTVVGLGVINGGVYTLFRKWHEAKREGEELVLAHRDAEPPYVWTYETDIPHECFDILRDGEKYCRGIVFCLDKLIG